MKKSLILNPTENIQMSSNKDYSKMEGLYISNDYRDENSKIIFAGRTPYTKKISDYSLKWCNLLNASDIDFRFLSGLHAHIITFMSIGNIGDTILLLPEIAGGHFSTQQILMRLGYKIIEMESDNKNYCVNKEKTIELINKNKPRFAFIDRSEGLYYEDFSWIAESGIPYCVFDASQYLTQIICGEYISPFMMGFDLIISTMHKNFPGPQKAFLATKINDNYWEQIKYGSSTYISNAHPKDMFLALESINYAKKIKEYSTAMLEISLSLERKLYNRGLNVIKKNHKQIPTQHIWMIFDSKEKCYNAYLSLESIGILTNYRLLPYNLGYGLRIGVGAAVQSGLRIFETEELADIIYQCIKNGYSTNLEKRCSNFIDSISKNGKMI